MIRPIVTLLALAGLALLARAFRVEPPEPAFGTDELEPSDYAGDYGAVPTSWTYSRDGLLGSTTLSFPDHQMWTTTTVRRN